MEFQTFFKSLMEITCRFLIIQNSAGTVFVERPAASVCYCIIKMSELRQIVFIQDIISHKTPLTHVVPERNQPNPVPNWRLQGNFPEFLT